MPVILKRKEGNGRREINSFSSLESCDVQNHFPVAGIHGVTL